MVGFCSPDLGLGECPPQADFPTVGTTEVLSITLPAAAKRSLGERMAVLFSVSRSGDLLDADTTGTSRTYITIYNTATVHSNTI